jgi:hypothetical protein
VPAFAPGTRARLLLREYERHFADDEETLNLIVTQLRKPKQVQRLVFAREFYLLDYQPEP